MRLLCKLALTLLSLGAAFADDVPEPDALDETTKPATTPSLNVSASVTFPQSEIFGVKLVNGQSTEAHLTFRNGEPETIRVKYIGGALWTQPFGDQSTSVIVRNLTLRPYDLEIPSMQDRSLVYSFATELHPQDLQLNLAAILMDHKSTIYTVQASSTNVSVVEAPTSIFDPQIIFLYLILAAAFASTSYFIYNTWITNFFPQQKRPRRDVKGNKSPAPRTPRPDSTLGSSNGSAAATGSQVYDESWIPDHHKARPETKRAKSSTGKAKTLAS